jgi:hypothetical protein
VEFTKGEVARKEALAWGGRREIDQDQGLRSWVGGSKAGVVVEEGEE